MTEPQKATLPHTTASVANHVAADQQGGVCLVGSETPLQAVPSDHLSCYDKTGTRTFITYTGEQGSPTSDVRVDTKGNSYVLTASTTGLESHPLYLNKYRPDGLLEWSRLVGAESGLALFDLTSSGHPTVYVEPADAEPGVLTRYNTDGQVRSQRSKRLGAYWAFELSERGNIFALDLPREGAEEICVNKYSPDGRLLWSRLCEDDLFGEMDLAPTRDDGVYVATAGSRGRSDPALYRLGADGTIRWRKVVASAGVKLAFRAVAADNDDNVYVAGDVTRVDSVSGAPSQNVFVRKYGPNGNFRWNRHHGVSELDERVADLDVVEEDVVYLGGTSAPHVAGEPVSPVEKAFVMKLSRMGDLAWER